MERVQPLIWGMAFLMIIYVAPASAGAAAENGRATAALDKQPLRAASSRMFEATFTSRRAYADPFNDIEVDVLFVKDGRTWRVPAYWAGGQRWKVRFAAPEPGKYSYRLESTDLSNTDLNGSHGSVLITAYQGPNALLRHGPLRVSANGRHLEHADGTPFHWLGDTWWTGLSSRLSWDGFRQLAADRRAKGFTVVLTVAGLIPNEEQPPSDPGYGNEGGLVWDAEYSRINPEYFDYADRRISHLLDQGLTPAIVGAWRDHLLNMGGRQDEEALALYRRPLRRLPSYLDHRGGGL